MSTVMGPPPRRGRAIDEQLIPLINIIFLLLVFFMVAGQIAPRQDLDVEPPASHSRGAVPAEALRVVLTRDGVLSLDGHRLVPEQLAGALRDLGGGREVALAADREVRARALAPVLAALRDAGSAQVTLYTRRVEQP